MCSFASESEINSQALTAAGYSSVDCRFNLGKCEVLTAILFLLFLLSFLAAFLFSSGKTETDFPLLFNGAASGAVIGRLFSAVGVLSSKRLLSLMSHPDSDRCPDGEGKSETQ